MGLRNGLIPTNDISVSSQKDPQTTLDAVRLDYSRIWVGASNDTSPWIEIEFLQSKFY